MYNNHTYRDMVQNTVEHIFVRMYDIFRSLVGLIDARLTYGLFGLKHNRFMVTQQH